MSFHGEDEYEAYLKGRGDLSPTAREASLVAAVRQLKSACDELRDGTLTVAAVVAAEAPVGQDDHGRVAVHTGEMVVSLRYPSYLKEEVERGDIVRVDDKAHVIAIEHEPPYYGAISEVTRIVDLSGRVAEVDGDRIVFWSFKAQRSNAPTVGEQVLLDFTRTCIVRRLGVPPSKMALSGETGVAWDDIGGQEDAKRELREMIEGPVLHPEVYKQFGLPVPKGVLLYGPPGNGKTMFGKAAATAIRSLHGTTAAATGFIYVKGPEVLNKYVGESEAGVRGIFEAARAHFRAHGYPAVVFVDEADALVGKRGSRESLGMETTIVPQFLAEMDGLEDSRAFLVLATNRPDALDPAVVRDGRVDLKVHVRRPTKEEAAIIIAKALVKRPHSGAAFELAEAAVEEIFGAKHGIAMIRVRRGSDRRVNLADFLSGSMAVGIVDRATKRAIRRHLETEPKGGRVAEGVTAEDIAEAIKETPEQLRHLDLTKELSDVIEEHCDGQDNVKRVEPIR